MKNTVLYLTTVLIWGSTWLAIEFQVGEAPIHVSVFYRFAIAAVCMWAYCIWVKLPMKFSLKNHAFIGVLALCNFSTNYALLYLSQEYLTSAMTSIAFSTMLVMNIVNTRLFFGTRIRPRVYIGALFGIFGIVALFWNDLLSNNNLPNTSAESSSLLGLALVLSGALIASLGNMASVRNSRAGMNVLAVNAWGMFYGAALLGLVVLLSGADFTLPSKTSYIASLLYLAIFGTVIAFATYYLLLNDMGPEKASYVNVLFPVVAVALSSAFEGFVWTSNTFLGFALVLIGNAITLTRIPKFAKRRKVIA